MRKVVINRQFGGFSLSMKAERRYLELRGKECYFYMKHNISDDNYIRVSSEAEAKRRWLLTHTILKDLGDTPIDFPDEYYWSGRDIRRDDPLLIQVIVELGDEANGNCATLRVVEIPDDVDWIIDEYDGNEWVAEKHRQWS